MAQSSGGDWKKDQEVQVYDTSKHQWITGKIYDIQEDDEEKIYCVEYDEYSLQIHEKDVHSLMRASEITEQSNERDAEEMFMNFSKQIAAKLPLSRQMQILSENARKINFQRMIYLYIEELRQFIINFGDTAHFPATKCFSTDYSHSL